jgi:RHS repeat-associated protein
LESSLARLRSTYERFLESSVDPPAGVHDHGLLTHNQVGHVLSQATEQEAFVKGVMVAFVTADTSVLPDWRITESLDAQGISQVVPGRLTIDEPTFKGAPINSGYSDDPVCVATGHFLVQERDFAMPETLAPLEWERTYNSRYVSDGPLGRGWSSWASTELVISDDTVEYHGPDGQLAVWITSPDSVLENPGLQATLERSDDGWELRWAWRSRYPGDRWSFDASGRLHQVLHPGAAAVNCIHEGTHLTELRSAGERTLRVEWTGERITSIGSSDGRRVSYDYEGVDLIAAESGTGRRTFSYDEAGHMLELVDADGVCLARNTYDQSGRVLTQESPFGRVTTYGYLGSLTTVVGDDAGGPRTLYRHDIAGRLTELVTAARTRLVNEYDERGNLVRVTGLDGGLTVRDYDDYGNCIREFAPDGTEQSWDIDPDGRVLSYTDQVGATFTFGHDSDDDVLPSRIEGPLGMVQTLARQNGLIVEETDADGVHVLMRRNEDGLVTAIVDDDGNTTTIDYSPSGLPSLIVYPTGERQEFGIDEYGQVHWAQNPAGDRIEMTWSPAGRCLTSSLPERGTVEFHYGPHGQPVAMVNAGGERTALEYDSMGNLTGVEWPGNATWAFEYDPMGQVIGVTDPTGSHRTQHWAPQGEFLGATDGLGRRTELHLDAAGRLVGLDTPGGRTIRLERDAAGRAVAREMDGDRETMERDLLGRPTVNLDAAGGWVAYEHTPGGRLSAIVAGPARWDYDYDPLGRMRALTGPDGGQRRYSYDARGRLAEVGTAIGGIRRLTWGPRNEVESVTSSAGPSADAASYRANPYGQVTAVRSAPGEPDADYRYDAAGQPVAVTDALGQSASLERDERGNLVAAVDAKGARWSWTVDPLGRALSTTDPLGRRTEYERDAAGQTVRTLGPDGQDLQWEWDADGNPLTVRVAGAVIQSASWDYPGHAISGADDKGREAMVRWDETERLLARSVGEDVTSWDYDDIAGRCTTTRPSGDVSVVDCDDVGRPASVWHPALGRVELRRDYKGRIASLEGPGLTRYWNYEGDRISVYRESVNGVASETRLEYDAKGNVTAEHRDGHSYGYRYDDADQLTGLESPEGTWEWSYDACGRMVEERGPEGIRTFTFDEADQLVALRVDDQVTEYTYDSQGRRITEQTGDHVVRYGWDPLGRLRRMERGRGDDMEVTEFELDAFGTLSSVNDRAVVWGSATAGCPIVLGETTIVDLAGMPLATVEGGVATLMSADWRGSVGRRSGPWGSPGAGGDSIGMGFLGAVEVGSLVWLHNRVYDPVTHAFLSRDPALGLPGSPGGLTNPYGYAGNNPLRWFDPLGLKPMSMDQFMSARAQAQQGWNWKAIGGWVAVAALAAGCVVLIVASGGIAAAPLAALCLGAGVGGIATGTVAIGQALLTHQPLDPWAIAEQMGTGMFVGGAMGVAGALVGGIGAITSLSGMAAFGAKELIGAGLGAAGGALQTGIGGLEDHNFSWTAVEHGAEMGAAAGALPLPDFHPVGVHAPDVAADGNPGGATGGGAPAPHGAADPAPSGQAQSEPTPAQAPAGGPAAPAPHDAAGPASPGQAQPEPAQAPAGVPSAPAPHDGGGPAPATQPGTDGAAKAPETSPTGSNSVDGHSDPASTSSSGKGEGDSGKGVDNTFWNKPFRGVGNKTIAAVNTGIQVGTNGLVSVQGWRNWQGN